MAVARRPRGVQRPFDGVQSGVDRRMTTELKPVPADYSRVGRRRTHLPVGVRLSLFGFVALLVAPLWAGNLDSARQLYHRTAYEAALSALEAEGSQDAAVLLLAGQTYYQLGQYREASERLEKASELRPESAEIFLWLGRSFGRMAEASSFFTALGHARRCREALERAVALDGKNVEAMSDLVAYYLEAPGFLGGSLGKAERLAPRIAALDAAEGQYVQARIAEQRKDFSGAEAHLRRAVEMAPRQIDRWIDLAKFFARRGDVQQSEQALAKAAEVAPETPKLLFARAELYIQLERNLEARMLLQRYLQMPLTPEDPPRREADRLLVKAGG
jgi:tetratricopeptide (TPR) repeat protein